MTYTQFLSQVRKLNKTWRYSKDTGFRCLDGDCPLTALQRFGGRRYPDWEAEIAAMRLGLQVSVAQRIIEMADTEIRPTPGFLRALGLKKKDLT